MKILIAEDDPSVSIYLETVLKEWGYEITSCMDGEQACAILQSEKISILLTDWMMPGLSGIELCQQIRSQIQPSYYIYIILITGKNSKDDLITAFNAGADDFITKPVVARELVARVKAAERVINLEQELLEKNSSLEAANQTISEHYQYIKNDLQAAAKIQRALLPDKDDTGLPVDLAWLYRPADELSGDLFGFYALDEKHLAAYLIDVAGHGVPAAMLSVYLKKMLSADKSPDSLVYSVSQNDSGIQFRTPAQIVERLNHKYCGENEELLHFTMIYLVLNVKTGAGKLCQAGHPYPLIARNNGTTDALGEGGYPVGLFADAVYQDYNFELGQGERLLLYSDGVTECADIRREQFGQTRLEVLLQQTLQQVSGASLDSIMRNIVAWHHGDAKQKNFDDDVSLISIELQEH